MDGELRKVRGNCSDGATCAAAYVTSQGGTRIVGRLITDPAELAQMGIGPGEVAIDPGDLLPEVPGQC